jgi:hypothetical protein
MDVFSTVSHGGGVSNEVASKTPLNQEEIDSLIDQGMIPIASREDLEAIQSSSSHTFAGILSTGGGLSKSYVVVRDINLTSGSGFNTSLINGTFTGTFDGNNYRLSNLTINASSTNDIGLFSRINGATIQNLILQDSSITGQDFVGGIVGTAVGNSNLENIHVKASSITGRNHVGGIIGNVTATSPIPTITMTDITNEGSVNGGTHVGGVIGYVSNATITMTAIINNGGVTGTGTNVGGVIGYVANATITMTAISNEGAATGQTAVGGIVGSLGNNTVTDISNTTNSGKVSASNSTANVGGIIGVSTGASNKLNISFTTNSGTVSAISPSTSAKVGGIIGQAYSGTITGSNINVTGPGTTTAANSTVGIGHIIGEIITFVTVDLEVINVNRPDSLKLVGTSINHDIKEGIADVINDVEPNFTDASIKRTP